MPRAPGGEADAAVYKYVLSCAAATVAETATYPLDLAKTRLQIQGEHRAPTAAARRGFFATTYGIAREEGVFRLWQGLGPAVVRHFVYTGVRMTVYEQMREHVLPRDPLTGVLPLWKAMACGATAGAVGQLLSSPTDLVKVHMQMEGWRRVQGLPKRVDSMLDAFTSVVRSGGVRALWAGWLPNVQRAALVNMADMATYDKVKQAILRNVASASDDWKTHVAAAACSGLAAALTSTPADVVKTRIMHQPTDAAGRGTLYRSSIDCLSATVRKEGVLALYKGFVPIWARMAPWSLTFWVSYEKIRRLCGQTSF